MNNLDRTKAPSFKQIESISLPNLTTGKLSNGIQFTSISGNANDVVQIDIFFRAGAIFCDKPYVAAFCSQMMYEGTTKHTAQQIADELEFYGISLTIQSDKQFANLSIMCLSKYAEHALNLVLEIICESNFPQNELDIIKNQSIQDLLINQEKTTQIARKEMYTTLYGANHVLGRKQSIDLINAVSQSDLINFHKKHYTAANCHLVITSNQSSNLISLIDKHLSAIPQGQKAIYPVQPQMPAISNNPIIIEKENTVQSSLCIGSQGIDITHPDFNDMYICRIIFGGFFGSRLMKNIREDKGLTYGIYASSVLYPFGSTLIIGADIKQGCSAQTLTEIRNEIDRMQNKPISANELSIARNYIMGSMLQLFDGPFNSIQAINLINQFDVTIDHFAQRQQRVQAITPNEIMEAARKYLVPEKMVTVIVGKP